MQKKHAESNTIETTANETVNVKHKQFTMRLCRTTWQQRRKQTQQTANQQTQNQKNEPNLKVGKAGENTVMDCTRTSKEGKGIVTGTGSVSGSKQL